ncbi:hypothetical protein Cgig2_014869 [Carnegiea gigantea]|uniref:Endonuclease/exonuclease/phosphatase domain-containing protein n=1 Tax=Carnegiea gigantea TaxID=171969 RepID=A0A9Q1QTL6_9CARY|nr:hypothetical protein Cgig2_014869 [Carnegiea gigantea]
MAPAGTRLRQQCITPPATVMLRNNFGSLADNGLNGPNKQDVVKNILAQNKFEVLGLFETKVKVARVEEIRARLGQWEVIANATVEYKSKKWVYWNVQKCRIKIMKIQKQFIHMKYAPGEGDAIGVTFIHGSNEASEKEELWKAIKRLSQITRYAWYIGGDFNSLLGVHERIRGIELLTLKIEEFIACVDILAEGNANGHLRSQSPTTIHPSHT